MNAPRGPSVRRAAQTIRTAARTMRTPAPARPTISPTLARTLSRVARQVRPLVAQQPAASPSSPSSPSYSAPSYEAPTYGAPTYGDPYADDVPDEEDDGADLDDFDENDEAWEGSEDPGQPEDARNMYDDDNWDAVGADVSRSPELTWTVDRTPTGWKGTVRVPLDLGRMLTVVRTVPKAAGANKATSTALDAASRVLDNPAVAALVPPQARMALNLVKSPTLRNAAKKITGLF